MTGLEPARARLGRIRCLIQAVEHMKRGEPLPEALCFVPLKLRLQCECEEPLEVKDEPKLNATVVTKLSTKKTHTLECEGKALFNADGGWGKLISPSSGNWVLLQSTKITQKVKWKLKDDESGDPMSWLKVVERLFSLQLVKAALPDSYDSKEMAQLQTPPPGWSLEADEELARFLVEQGLMSLTDTTVQGSEHFVKIEASSEESQVPHLLDTDQESYWESDGEQGSHWLRFHMKPGTIVQKLCLLVDPDDCSYLPKRVQIKAGVKGSLSVVQTRSFSSGDFENRELSLFPYPCSQHYPVIEIHFKSCYQGGIDTRIHGIKVVCTASDSIFDESETVSKDLFTSNAITRWPKLQAFKPEQLYYRAIMLKRIATLIDKDLSYLLPPWNLSSGSLEAISTMRQLWPLCKARNLIVDQMLQETVSSVPSNRPVLFINRIAAKQHRDNLGDSADYNKTVFYQIITELKKHTNPSKYNYRWAGQWTQWWECKFIQEGAIDQGGGFRDSLAEMAEELCPSSPANSVPLPFFVRSPNQSQDSSNAYRDTFTLNPSCKQVAKYHFIGQLMGAAFRSPESLVLSLPQFIWKQLVGEPVTWTRDFVTVDSAEVKFTDSIEMMEKEKFDAAFSGSLNFVTVLSNGTTISLIPGGEDKEVTFEDRLQYCELVKEKRMKESELQIKALLEGLCMVVPKKVLSLLTWQELEEKVCGRPEIPLSALKQSARYDSGISENSQSVRIMWEALETFTNEERSRFIRFITGRRRLPVTIYIDSADSGPSSLPTSATCSNALYLPSYTSVDQASEKLRYAAYNCVAIDTDMSPWE